MVRLTLSLEGDPVHGPSEIDASDEPPGIGDSVLSDAWRKLRRSQQSIERRFERTLGRGTVLSSGQHLSQTLDTIQHRTVAKEDGEPARGGELAAKSLIDKSLQPSRVYRAGEIGDR
jgi:hypothetical protein